VSPQLNDLKWEPGNPSKVGEQVASFLSSNWETLSRKHHWSKAADGFMCNTPTASIYLTQVFSPHSPEWYFEVQIHTSQENTLWSKSFEIHASAIIDISTKHTWAHHGLHESMEVLWNERFPPKPYDAFNL